MVIDDVDQCPSMSGRVKWFDSTKGFGFVLADQGGPDILLHANVLRGYGWSTVADGSAIVLEVLQTERGLQATRVLSIEPPELSDVRLADLDDLDPALLSQASLQPARVRWFNRSKGFGFACVWGSAEDVFVHSEVLRRSGLANLETGEAVGLRIINGRQGPIAIEVVAWSVSARTPGS